MPITIIPLGESDRSLVKNFYANLDAESRYQRFGSSLSPLGVDRYLSRLSFEAGMVFGAFDGDKLVGVCESSRVPSKPGIREVSFVVAPDYRHQQVASQLGKAMLATTGDQLVVACTYTNPFMNRLAKNLGFKLVDLHQPRGLPTDLIDTLLTPQGLFAADGFLKGH